MFRSSILAVMGAAVCVALAGASRLAAQEGVSLAINEIVASNGAAGQDPQGQYDDWIEIYNYGDTPVDLAGMYLTDDPNEPAMWQVPAGVPALTTVPAHGYAVIWADGDTADDGLHASFKLDADGEYVGLFAADGATVIDSVSFPALVMDLSYGRYPDNPEQWRFFAEPTPGARNEGAYEGLVKPVEFSHRRGFYDEPFTVTLSTPTPETTIYYTLDAENPGQPGGRALSGLIYRGPIEIRRTTCLRAVARRDGWKPSPIGTQTYIFVADVVVQSPSGQSPGSGWPSPTVSSGGGGWFPGGGMGGGQVIDYGMDPEVVNDPRYKDLVDDALLSLPSISLVTPLANLFNPSTGIYVNALQDGIAWERPVSVELIYPDGTEGFQIDAGLRIRGGYGRQGDNAKHGFRLFFRAEYGASRLKYPLFEDEGVDEFEKVDLRAEQNYSWAFKGSMGDDNGSKNSLLRDVFSRDLQGATGQPYTRSRYYHLYLNGQYWGIYQTQERSEARYAASYFGGEAGDYDVAKVDAGPGRPYTIHATDGNLDAYNRLWQLAAKGFGTDAAYYQVQGLNPDGTPNPVWERLVDVDNLIDYMICTFYVGDLDAPISSFLQNSRPNNFYAIYNRTNPDGFKFFRHDCEHTMFNVNENRTGPYSAGQQAQYFNPQWLHQQLTAHPEYRMRFADHVYKHFFNDGVMTPAAATRLLTARKNTIDLAIIAESARWGDAKVAKPRTKDDDWLPQVRFLLNDYLPKRTDIVLGQFKAKGWYPSVEAPAFNEHGGAVDRGFGLVMTAPAGAVYYTLDGTDPRLSGGAVSASAIAYTGPVVLTKSARIRARALQGGVWSAVHDATFAVGPVAEGLRISEIMYHARDTGDDADPGAEYVELTNIADETINLHLARFTDGIDFVFSDFELAPGAHCLVVDDISAFEARYGPGLPIAGQYAGKLANGGETIELVDAVGTVIHRFAYADNWYEATDGGGFSLTMVDVTDPDPAAWSLKEGWQASSLADGSPGADDPGLLMRP
ncbi:MAG TPA: lamin tail domain-containing protein [Sedimentisphaerales bacterium]|nr:lamin tail domain-containing protein [Sedimentisphaerales bacterium]HRS13002.1 lamin tail domain-containing protein [Sedimentisphaerales bacterium]HRV49576.1 lamin tail domain-containing protein [Sedimentisphaerales bacterium]